MSTINQVAYRIMTAFDYSSAGDPVRQAMVADAMNTAAKDIAIRTRIFERTFTQDLVLNTDVYAYPAGFFSVVRIVANSWTLAPISKAEYDARVGIGSATIPTGQPTGYMEWGRSITTFPKWGQPTVTNGLVWWGFGYPTQIAADDVTATVQVDMATLGVPPEWEKPIVDGAISTLAAWFKDLPRAQFHERRYEQAVRDLFIAAEMNRYRDQLRGVTPSGIFPES